LSFGINATGQDSNLQIPDLSLGDFRDELVNRLNLKDNQLASTKTRPEGKPSVSYGVNFPIPLGFYPS